MGAALGSALGEGGRKARRSAQRWGSSYSEMSVKSKGIQWVGLQVRRKDSIVNSAPRPTPTRRRRALVRWRGSRRVAGSRRGRSPAGLRRRRRRSSGRRRCRGTSTPLGSRGCRQPPRRGRRSPRGTWCWRPRLASRRTQQDTPDKPPPTRWSKSQRDRACTERCRRKSTYQRGRRRTGSRIPAGTGSCLQDRAGRVCTWG